MDKVTLKDLKDGWYRIEDQDGICHMQTEDKERAESYVLEFNNCQHEADLTLNERQTGQGECLITVTCDFCGAEAEFPFPVNLEWF